MMIVSRVCAIFHNSKGEKIFEVRPDMRGTMQEAPEAIREDLLFQMLVNDGSLKAVEDAADRKRLENEPMAGTDAEGRNATDAALAKAARGGKGKTVREPEKAEEGKTEAGTEAK